MMKRISLVLLALLFTFLSVTAHAEADMPPASQIAASGSSVVEWYNRSRADGDLISYTKAGINAGTGCVVVSGKTETGVNVNTIGVIFTIQQWKNSQWNNYYSITCNDFETNAIYKIKTISVESGYYYRLYAVHKAYNGPDSQLKVSITSSVYVN